MNAKVTGASGTISKSKKNQPAPMDLISAIGRLFSIAANQAAPMQLKAMTRDKLYEMFVLMRLMRRFKSKNPHGCIVHVPPLAGGKKIKLLWPVSRRWPIEASFLISIFATI